jgi:DNA-binding transcriptional MerR regulator/quercetin dioxygenase-like cupin family protein
VTGHEFVLTIGEVARRAGVSPGTIRLWEQEGLIAPYRSSGGVRQYDELQIRKVDRIGYLRNVNKLNLSAIKAILRDEFEDEPESSRQRQIESYGRRLRSIRLRKGLTLAQVAEGVDLSISFISALEREQAGASVATRQRIMRFYGTTEHELLGTQRSTNWGTLTTLENRQRVYDTFSKVTSDQLLPARATIGAVYTIVEPGGGSQGHYTHDGEEFLLMVEGSLTVTLAGTEVYRLRPDDCLFFPSTVEHEWQNTGSLRATLLWVSTPPTY